jgi:2-oxoglutarate dehydrogenase E2 component (dihydrolipoamide succinyltransferase)
MAIEIKVPTLGESVTEATVSRWLKAVGDRIGKDENIAELETDKVTLDVPSPVSGKVISLTVAEGETVSANAILAEIEEGAGEDTPAPTSAPATSAPATPAPATPAPAPAPAPATSASGSGNAASAPLSPAVRRIVDENNLDPASITGTGKDGRLTKGDVLAAGTAPKIAPAPALAPAAPPAPRHDDAREERVPMSRLRQVIARRLKDAQNTAAMLTTFNEVDMTAVMALRGEYKDSFEKRHGVKLGFMSFFVHAVIEALKDYPAVNAEIHGNDIIYKNYYNIGVAVGTPQGLVVPVLRDADRMSFAETEASINSFGDKARQGKLSMADMSDGTFTISNGGIYGSMLSTPILNPPQSGILGMHNIQKRAVVVSGKGGDEIVVRPMMYLALSYDHRIIDGREAVSFLVRVKQSLEDPRRLLIGL